MGIKIEGLEGFQKKIRRLKSVFNGTRVENEIGEQFKLLVKQTFNDKKSPFGRKWESSSNPDTLVDTGALFRSVSYKSTQGKIVVFAGSGLEYARVHNNGEGIFPQRQFIPNKGKLPKKWRDIAINIIEKEIKDVIKIRFK